MMGIGHLSIAARAVPARQKRKVKRILSAVTARGGPLVEPAEHTSTSYVLRRVKRLTWFALVACVALIAAFESSRGLSWQVSGQLALAVILVASWAILVQVTGHLRTEDARRAAASEAARLEGARMTASAMQDRIANKLSLTVGYTEFLVTDPRMPEDLRDHAQRAMNGAKAAAEQMSELKRVTRQEYEARLVFSGSAPTTPGKYDSDQLREMVRPVSGDEISEGSKNN
jgi:hypothetical protein